MITLSHEYFTNNDAEEVTYHKNESNSRAIIDKVNLINYRKLLEKLMLDLIFTKQ